MAHPPTHFSLGKTPIKNGAALDGPIAEAWSSLRDLNHFYLPYPAPRRWAKIGRPSRGWLLGAAYLPVPVRLEDCGLPTALSLTCRLPVLVPVCVGVKITLILQLDLAARLVEQVDEETLKSPVVEVEIPVRATLCLLVRVKTLAALLDPTLVAGKVLVAGVKVTGTVPVPERATVCGLLAALSVMVKVPVRAPT